ncbi:MAG: hypothetical protein CMJ40_09330 [Phycisphaerae bacterium]|nr:hypothetical protein [Phycisphaerae bacterium]|tara:strand:- start:2468 stop:3244 length:777 start_codon:yes stop_codon:yes gene_type:complete
MSETLPPTKKHLELKVYDLFLIVVAVVAIVVIIWQLFLVQNPEIAKLLHVTDFVICIIFFIDYIRQIVAASNKWRYIFTWGIFDLISSIPAVGPLRALKIVRIIRIIRVIRSLRIISQTLIRDKLASAVSMLALIGSMTILLCCIGVLHYESSAPGATIKTAQDVTWWAVVTTSTVGYGDMYPITAEGRVMAVVIMCVGIGLFATFAGALAGIFMRKPKDIPTSAAERYHFIVDQNNRVLARLDELDQKIKDLQEEKS